MYVVVGNHPFAPPAYDPTALHADPFQGHVVGGAERVDRSSSPSGVRTSKRPDRTSSHSSSGYS